MLQNCSELLIHLAIHSNFAIKKLLAMELYKFSFNPIIREQLAIVSEINKRMEVLNSKKEELEKQLVKATPKQLVTFVLGRSIIQNLIKDGHVHIKCIRDEDGVGVTTSEIKKSLKALKEAWKDSVTFNVKGAKDDTVYSSEIGVEINIVTSL